MHDTHSVSPGLDGAISVSEGHALSRKRENENKTDMHFGYFELDMGEKQLSWCSLHLVFMTKLMAGDRPFGITLAEVKFK